MQYCCRVVVGDCFWNTHIVETITATRLTVWQSARLSLLVGILNLILSVIVITGNFIGKLTGAHAAR